MGVRGGEGSEIGNFVSYILYGGGEGSQLLTRANNKFLSAHTCRQKQHEDLTHIHIYTHASIAWAQDQTLSWRWYGDILWVSLLDWIPETKGLLVQTTKILHSTYIGGVH